MWGFHQHTLLLPPTAHCIYTFSTPVPLFHPIWCHHTPASPVLRETHRPTLRRNIGFYITKEICDTETAVCLICLWSVPLFRYDTWQYNTIWIALQTNAYVEHASCYKESQRLSYWQTFQSCGFPARSEQVIQIYWDVRLTIISMPHNHVTKFGLSGYADLMRVHTYSDSNKYDRHVPPLHWIHSAHVHQCGQNAEGDLSFLSWH